MARGKHLFPFRTEQLSPSAPMVLGSQEPGRVGRRRFDQYTGRPSGRPVVVVPRASAASPRTGGLRGVHLEVSDDPEVVARPYAVGRRVEDAAAPGDGEGWATMVPAAD